MATLNLYDSCSLLVSFGSIVGSWCRKMYWELWLRKIYWDNLRHVGDDVADVTSSSLHRNWHTLFSLRFVVMLCSFVDICSRCSSLHVCCTSQRARGRKCCSNFLNILVRIYMILLAYLGSSIMPWVRACCGIVAISTSQWNCIVLSASTSSWSVVSHGVAEGARDQTSPAWTHQGHRHGGGFPQR